MRTYQAKRHEWAITAYYKKHPTSKVKLTTNEWVVTKEVCSLLDTISEVTTGIQGSMDTRISQMTFIMREMVEVHKLENHLIRTGEVENGHQVTEETAVILHHRRNRC